MLAITDSRSAATELLGDVRWQQGLPGGMPAGWKRLQEQLYHTRQLFHGELEAPSCWQGLFLVDHATGSHFDLPGFTPPLSSPGRGIVCAARSGDGFHGWHGRSWSALSGNLHLTFLLTPQLPARLAGSAFQILAAVSTLRTVDDICSSDRSGIKWVNDLLLDDHKVGGVLARTQTQGDRMTGAVLGIGLNVMSAPEIPPAPSVPRSGSLRTLVTTDRELNLSTVFRSLLDHLGRDYRQLQAEGVAQLLELYRRRSLVIGREIILLDDRPGFPLQELARGKVVAIGDNLELYLEGRQEPITGGRLVMGEEEE